MARCSFVKSFIYSWLLLFESTLARYSTEAWPVSDLNTANFNFLGGIALKDRRIYRWVSGEEGQLMSVSYIFVSHGNGDVAEMQAAGRN